MKKILHVLVLFLMATTAVTAQSKDPVVQNISMRQTTTLN